MAVPSNYAALVTAIDAILTTYGLSLFQVFGGRSTQPSLRELISLRWKLFSMTTPANYATLIAEIDVVIESYGLSLQEVFGGRSTQPTLQELIDLRYELFEVDGGASDPSQITSETAPTTRADGSALQQGDRWYNPSTGVNGFWNGTYWLTSDLYKCLVLTTAGSSVGGTTSGWAGDFFNATNKIFITEQWLNSRFVPSLIGDKWEVQIGFTDDPDGVPLTLPIMETVAVATNIYTYKTVMSLNTAYDLPAFNINIVRYTLTKTGTSSAFVGSAGFNYRIIL